MSTAPLCCIIWQAKKYCIKFKGLNYPMARYRP